MSSRASLTISPDTLCTLLVYLRMHGRFEELDEIADHAVLTWLEQAKADGFRQRTSTVRGYQWKELFLPDGTRLRSRNYEQFHYAAVVGDEIIYGGRPVSPNQFNSAVPGIVRNAWRDIFLLFPGERQWKRAIDCRRELGAYARQPMPLPPLQPPTRPAPSRPPPRSAKPATLPSWDGAERREGYRRQEDLLLD